MKCRFGVREDNIEVVWSVWVERGGYRIEMLVGHAQRDWTELRKVKVKCMIRENWRRFVNVTKGDWTNKYWTSMLSLRNSERVHLNLAASTLAENLCWAWPMTDCIISTFVDGRVCEVKFSWARGYLYNLFQEVSASVLWEFQCCI